VSGAPFLLHGLTLALVWFLAVNVAVSLFVAAFAQRLTRKVGIGSPAFWLALRLLPAAASIVFVGVVFLPSYWRYEPREFVEGFDSTLAALALVALAICGAAAVRGVLAWRRTSTRARAWLQLSQPLTMPEIAMPAYQIDIPTPMMALVGVVSPRLFITRGVLDALTREELAAAVAHELGHWRAADNLKRLAMRSAPDLLAAIPASRAVERRWASAAEHAADRRAADVVEIPEKRRARCALASALVKVARLMPSTTPTLEPISTLVDGGDIASRVHSLLDDAPVMTPAHSSVRWTTTILAAAAAAVLAYTPLLRAVHALTELIVSRF
jgi:Zn-dependent protease with chaperone function